MVKLHVQLGLHKVYESWGVVGLAGGPDDDLEELMEWFQEFLHEGPEAHEQLKVVKHEFTIYIPHLVCEDVRINQKSVQGDNEGLLVLVLLAQLKLFLFLG